MPKANIDQLLPKRSLIDLDNYQNDTFSLVGYELKTVLDDILLVKYVDISEDGKSVMRNGLLIPINTMTKAWRIGQVILAGPNVQFTKPGDIVCFPNDRGIPASNLTVAEVGSVKDAIFLNEDRIFGVCKARSNESKLSKPKNATRE